MSRPRNTPSRCLAPWLLGAALLLNPPAHAQDAKKGTSVDFELEPFYIESIGLNVNLPLQAQATTTWVGQEASVRITPPDTTWIVTIQSAEPKDKGISPSAFADKIIEQLQQSSAGHDGVFDRKGPHKVGGKDADAFYFRFPGVGSEPVRINGYEIVSTAPDRVVSFTLVTTEPELRKARIAFEGMLSTAAFTDPRLAEVERAIAISHAESLLATLRETGLDPYLSAGQERWERFFKPADTKLDADDAELGYRRIRSWAGQRGEMDAARPKSRWSAVDQDKGYLLKIDSRLLLEAEIVDASSVYFASLDRTQEAWKTTMAIKSRAGGGKPVVWTEIGARAGNDLTVQTEGAGQPGQTVTATIPDTGYLSQVESLLLTRILAAGAPESSYGFYTYRPANSRIMFRNEEIEHPGGPGGQVRVKSIMESGQQPVVTTLTASGDLVNQVLPDGRVWEPIKLDSLYDLWRRKGLPIE